MDFVFGKFACRGDPLRSPQMWLSYYGYVCIFCGFGGILQPHTRATARDAPTFAFGGL